MTTTNAAKRQAEFNTRALNTLRQVSWQCEDFTEAELLPFNTNPNFNSQLASYLKDPGFILKNGHWDRLLQLAKDSLVPDGEGNVTYKSSSIAADPYGSAVVYICMLMVFSYGEACAMKSLHAHHPLGQPGSMPGDIARECAFKLIGHTSRYECGFQTLQDIAITRQLSAAALKVTIRKMVQRQVTDFFKSTVTQPELHAFDFESFDDLSIAAADNFEVEDQLQLEYLQEFMQRAVDDLEKSSDNGVAKMVLDIYLSDEGQKLLRCSQCNRTQHRATFLNQLYKLIPLTELSKPETKAAHDEILASFHQLLRLSQERKVLKRQRIKSPAMRHYVRTGAKRYQGESQMETAEFIETRIHSPYVTDEDYDLMSEAAANDSFFTRTGSAFALN